MTLRTVATATLTAVGLQFILNSERQLLYLERPQLLKTLRVRIASPRVALASHAWEKTALPPPDS